MVHWFSFQVTQITGIRSSTFSHVWSSIRWEFRCLKLSGLDNNKKMKNMRKWYAYVMQSPSSWNRLRTIMVDRIFRRTQIYENRLAFDQGTTHNWTSHEAWHLGTGATNISRWGLMSWRISPVGNDSWQPNLSFVWISNRCFQEETDHKIVSNLVAASNLFWVLIRNK